MLNRITLMGRLARAPELRKTQSDTSVASFSIAVDRDFKDKESGERITDWIDIVAWRQTADFCAKHLDKGRMVVVEGRLQIRDWTDKEGGKRRSAEVLADNVYFADSKRDGDATDTAPAAALAAKAKKPAKKETKPADDFADVDVDGDLPF